MGEVSGGRAHAGAALRPDPRAVPKPAATQIPSLLGSPVQYVIITNDALAAEFQRLADWKTQTGVPAVVRTLSLHPASSTRRGRTTPSGSAMFIRDAYSRWGTKWVLLGGDTEIIPDASTPAPATTAARTSRADMYFSCLDGNWNADGNRYYGEAQPADPSTASTCLPEVYVGRAPVATVADAKQFVDKTLQYTSRRRSATTRTRCCSSPRCCSRRTGRPAMPIELDGAMLAEERAALDSQRTRTCATGASTRTTRTRRGSPGALPETREAVLDSLNRGYNVAVHIGHGYRNVMSVGDRQSLTTRDALALTNGNRLTNLYAINCTSNAIDFPCIGEAFLHAQNGGAVTSVGSTRFDFPVRGPVLRAGLLQGHVRRRLHGAWARRRRGRSCRSSSSPTYDNAYRWTQFTLLDAGRSRAADLDRQAAAR